MIQDSSLSKAVAEIRQRSERQQDANKLVGTFVDVGILPQIDTSNNQIVYGRRGTGKTHIFRVLETNLTKDPNNAVLYLDARVLGSTAQFSDPRAQLSHRCICLFRDMLGEIYNTLERQMIANPPEDSQEVFEELERLNTLVSEPIMSFGKGEFETRKLDKVGDSSSAGISADLHDGLGLKFELTSESTKESENKISRQFAGEDKIIFPAIFAHLRTLMTKGHFRFFLLIDEWSSIPRDVQPYLAEFFKRSFLANPDVVIKIAALEARSSFGIRNGTSDILGFELGSDIPTIDIDDYYIYDKNPLDVVDAFADVLYKHLTSGLPDGYLGSRFGIHSPGKLIDKMFLQLAIFQELARASEGVVRDLINIFTRAYFAAQRRGKDEIDKKAVLEAARQWFEQDKQRNLDDKLKGVLQRIVAEVVGNKKVRSFLIPRSLERHPVIQQLFDLRVIHLVQRGYVDKENPSLRYNIYTLDYGTYVDLIEVSNPPQGFFVFGEYLPKDVVVPFGDKRCMQKIILTEAALSLADPKMPITS